MCLPLPETLSAVSSTRELHFTSDRKRYNLPSYVEDFDCAS